MLSKVLKHFESSTLRGWELACNALGLFTFRRWDGLQTSPTEIGLAGLCGGR